MPRQHYVDQVLVCGALSQCARYLFAVLGLLSLFLSHAHTLHIALLPPPPVVGSSFCSLECYASVSILVPIV